MKRHPWTFHLHRQWFQRRRFENSLRRVRVLDKLPGTYFMGVVREKSDRILNVLSGWKIMNENVKDS